MTVFVLFTGFNSVLVQVAAEVQARYAKNYVHMPGMEMIGVLTASDRENVETCQILITEPYCAELLTTAPHYRRLMARVRYVIFDEVHNIVGTDGKVWENLLTLTHSPFIALSATVGNPDDFGGWLNSLEKARLLVFVAGFLL
jgi:superfamily II RNA helicase